LIGNLVASCHDSISKPDEGKASRASFFRQSVVIFPTAAKQGRNLGVSLVPIKDAVYADSYNRREAQVMVERIIQHMTEHPKQSLGVVVLNKKQQELLSDEYQAAAQQSTAAQKFEAHWEHERDGLEPFFIKNLENVQGDERDCIFIGTVYGPDEHGKVMNRFGPISGQTGRRRLNVLFSRAKERIVTFSSMTPDDIRVTQPENQGGAWMLKKWLEYAYNGHLDTGDATFKEPDSDFERHVISVIRSLGYNVDPQVGVQGFFIDIGVRHPDYPYGYLLGVECDGATYHSSKSARDRDRLRQEILEAKGWTLHRIWSTDWFTDPFREREKLAEVLEKRLKAVVEPSQHALTF
ncbi:AAA domain-containing protein, partial [Modicisalibacter xianhensis]